MNHEEMQEMKTMLQAVLAGQQMTHAKVEGLESNMNTMDLRIMTLQVNMNNLGFELKSDIRTMQGTINTMQSKITRMESTIETMQDNISSMQDDISTIQETLATNKDFEHHDRKVNTFADRMQKNELDIAMIKEKLGLEF